MLNAIFLKVLLLTIVFLPCQYLSPLEDSSLEHPLLSSIEGLFSLYLNIF